MANVKPHITDPERRQMLGLPPLTGWEQRFRGAQGEGAVGSNAWYNYDAGVNASAR